MKNFTLILKAVLITPFVIASGWLIFIVSYTLIPILIILTVFTVLKASDESQSEDDDEVFSNRRHK